MRTGAAIPTVKAATPLVEGLMEMSRKGLGMTAIVADDGSVLGIFTDGDLRRAIDAAVDLRTTRMDQVMSRRPKTVRPTTLAAEAVHLMETHSITSLIVTDAADRIAGALNVHDLMRAGVV
jgi:arabinose-5-phosphate isomerase